MRPPALAHAPGDGAAFEVLLPAVLLAVGVTGVLVARRGRRGGAGRSGTLRGLCGLLLLAVALGPPLDPLAEALLTAHMVQHLLLLVAIAPLFVASVTLPALLGRLVLRLPRSRRGRLRRWWRSGTRLLHRPAGILLVAALHVVVLLLWHVPALYDAALRSPLVHLVEHVSFLVVAVLFWWSVAVAGHRRDGGVLVAALVSCGLALAAGLALAVLLTFAAQPWYAHHHHAQLPGLGPVDPLTDQQLAGVVMWLAGGPAYVAAATWLLAGLLRRAARPDGPRLPAVLAGQPRE